jgi:hypothetical protein
MNKQVKSMVISIAREFSDTPGPRSRTEGEFSGQQFLEELLEPRFEEAIKSRAKLRIDFDGTEGYATSFLEAAFGGLARKYSAEQILMTLEFKCEDEPLLKNEITTYIKEARNK